MNLFPCDAPSNARPCEECDGHGEIVVRWPDGDVRYVFDCQTCDGGGHILCQNWRAARRAGCTGFAEHFFDEGEDTYCDHCWTTCSKCGEKLVFIDTESGSPFCTVCESETLRGVRTADLTAAARR